MIFIETELKGLYLIRPELLKDERGYFARTFCVNEFNSHGLNPNIVQCNVSFNKKKGTLRGMHYQISPKAEAKLVRCTKGSIFDVVADIRKDSSTYCKWLAFELNEEHNEMLYIPEGCAHGFQTIKDNTEVFYQMTEFYASEYTCGIRWNDPTIGIQWLEGKKFISQRDLQFPDFTP